MLLIFHETIIINILLLYDRRENKVIYDRRSWVRLRSVNIIILMMMHSILEHCSLQCFFWRRIKSANGFKTEVSKRNHVLVVPFFYIISEDHYLIQIFGFASSILFFESNSDWMDRSWKENNFVWMERPHANSRDKKGFLTSHNMLSKLLKLFRLHERFDHQQQPKI